MKLASKFIVLLLIFPTISQAQEMPFGLWQFQSKAVYIEILESGETFQCRIASDNSVIGATGKFDGAKTIQWNPVTIKTEKGELLDAGGFSWKTDTISLHDGELTLTGEYGVFEFSKCCATLPKVCNAARGNTK